MGNSKRLILNLILVTGCSLILMGCPNYAKIANFQAHALSQTRNSDVMLWVTEKKPKKNQEQESKQESENEPAKGENLVALIPIQKSSDEKEKVGGKQEFNEPDEIFASRQALYNSLDICNAKGLPGISNTEKIAAEVVILPLVAATAKLIFNNYIDDITNKAEALTKSAKRSYAVTEFIDNDKLKNTNCLILGRKSELKKKVDDQLQYGSNWDLLIMIKKEEVGDNGFYLRPLYAEIDNSVAITDINDPSLDLTVGLALKTIGTQQSKIPGLFSLGEAAIPIPGLSFQFDKNEGSKRFKNMKDLDKIKSEMIPYNVNGKSMLSLSVSVVETGNVGFNFEQAKTELEAIKDALGPAIETSINAFAE